MMVHALETNKGEKMKKRSYLLVMVLLVMAATGWCKDKTIYSASAITVDGLMTYYSSMGKLKDVDQLTVEKINYHDMCDYIHQNREKIITRVAETRSFNNLGRASQIINSLYENQTAYHAYGNLQHKATAQEYFDTVTGHRYYRTGAETYAEFTQKGAFLKTVPSDLPLLTKSRHIQPITKDNYILYQKIVQGKKIYLALPGKEAHPKGWKADKALISLK